MNIKYKRNEENNEIKNVGNKISIFSNIKRRISRSSVE